MIPFTVHFQKYHIPTSLLKLQPVSNTVWRKKAGFRQLVSTIYGLLKLHSVYDLIPLIAREVPMKNSSLNRRQPRSCTRFYISSAT